MRVGYVSNTDYYERQRAVREQAAAVGGMQEKLLHSGFTMDAVEEDSAQADAVMETMDISADDYGYKHGLESYHYKVLKEQEYKAELEDAKINDPEKYERMMSQRQEDIAKSFRQIEEMAAQNGGQATYNGTTIQFDYSDMQMKMSVGDTTKGDVINVGKLSNGYSFSFNMDNVDQVAGMLDLFSPEDINKILEAITKHKMVKEAEAEVEDFATQEVTAGAVKQPQQTEETGTAGAADEIEGSNVSSEVVENADGSRNLMITMIIGDEEVVTKIPLPPMREYNQFRMEKGTEEYEKQFSFEKAEAL